MALKVQPLTAEEIIELSKRYTLFDWAGAVEGGSHRGGPARGMYFWDADGKRYLDFTASFGR